MLIGHDISVVSYFRNTYNVHLYTSSENDGYPLRFEVFYETLYSILISMLVNIVSFNTYFPIRFKFLIKSKQRSIFTQIVYCMTVNIRLF